jgi:hypothetical protein
MKTAIALTLTLTSVLAGAENTLTPQEKAAGWILLFDGKTLEGWNSSPPQTGRGAGRAAATPKAATPAPAGAPAQGSHPRECSTALGKAQLPPGASHWDVIDGALSPCGEPAGYLTSKESYKDFVLAVDFKTGEDTNSGVFVRTLNGINGYEVQIWREQPAGYNTGSIVGTAKTDKEYKFKADAWNHYEITAQGDHLVVVLNGVITLDAHDSKYAEGRVLLQYQKFPIEFRNIKLRPLK